ncbi:hypothetical protein [Puniceicoccus vermicola]|uniref:Uncharacterized protein n=1 Tax=Puniceicoccus vermicola TaxID=388746 RepID=A0A7X1AV67_9BACT|nr:hypothetical protein [Puniceicoccus vermicola]MBC2600537.1 hypothetical protein [Puniceicoccus vermicola]
MKLPKQAAENITKALTSVSLLEEATAKEVVDALDGQKSVNWNIILTKQFKAEKGDQDEVES